MEKTKKKKKEREGVKICSMKPPSAHQQKNG